jgi:hypothetical protein
MHKMVNEVDQKFQFRCYKIAAGVLVIALRDTRHIEMKTHQPLYNITKTCSPLSTSHFYNRTAFGETCSMPEYLPVK